MNINFRYAISNFKKNKVYTSLNIFGLAVGFAVVAIISLFLISEQAKDSNIPNYKNIYRLYRETPAKSSFASGKEFALDYNENQEIEDLFPEIEDACAVRTFFGFEAPIASKENAIMVDKMFLTTNHFFSFFDITIIEKSTDVPMPDKNSTVITESLADKLFPNGNAIGNEISLFGAITFKVSAIVKDFNDKSLNANFIARADNPDFSNWGQSDNRNIATHYFSVVPNTEIKELEQKITVHLSQYQYYKYNKAHLMPLSDVYLHSSDIGYNAHEQGNTKMLTIFMAVALVILLLSVINNVNYSLSLKLSNLKSIGIHKTSGATFINLLKMFFAENFVKVCLAIVISVLLVAVSLPYIDNLLGKSIGKHLFFTPQFILPALLLIILVVFINSGVSMAILSKFDINSFMKGGVKEKKNIGQNVLTTFQLAVSVGLIISIIIFHKQISFVKTTDLGFNKEQIVRVEMTGANKIQELFKEQVDKHAFVKSSSLSNGTPGYINYRGAGKDDNGNKFKLNQIIADAGFIKTLGITLANGRDFMKGDNKVCIINKAALKAFGWSTFHDKSYTGRGDMDIIGVVEDFNISSLHTLPEPVVLMYGEQWNDYAQLNIRLHQGNVNEMIASLKEDWEKLNIKAPFSFTFYDEIFDTMYQKEERTASVINVFALIALFITSIGILSLSYQNSVRRTKEIGIRKVNGATVSEILAMLNKDFIKWVAFAFVIATPVSWYAMNKWLENFAYKTNLSWWIFALAGVLALGIALLTVSWQSWRAATRNPVEALRYE